MLLKTICLHGLNNINIDASCVLSLRLVLIQLISWTKPKNVSYCASFYDSLITLALSKNGCLQLLCDGMTHCCKWLPQLRMRGLGVDARLTRDWCGVHSGLMRGLAAAKYPGFSSVCSWCLRVLLCRQPNYRGCSRYLRALLYHRLGRGLFKVHPELIYHLLKNHGNFSTKLMRLIVKGNFCFLETFYDTWTKRWQDIARSRIFIDSNFNIEKISKNLIVFLLA